MTDPIKLMPGINRVEATTEEDKQGFQEQKSFLVKRPNGTSLTLNNIKEDSRTSAQPNYAAGKRAMPLPAGVGIPNSGTQADQNLQNLYIKKGLRLANQYNKEPKKRAYAEAYANFTSQLINQPNADKVLEALTPKDLSIFVNAFIKLPCSALRQQVCAVFAKEVSRRAESFEGLGAFTIQGLSLLANALINFTGKRPPYNTIFVKACTDIAKEVLSRPILDKNQMVNKRQEQALLVNAFSQLPDDEVWGEKACAILAEEVSRQAKLPEGLAAFTAQGLSLSAKGFSAFLGNRFLYNISFLKAGADIAEEVLKRDKRDKGLRKFNQQNLLDLKNSFARLNENVNEFNKQDMLEQDLIEASKYTEIEKNFSQVIKLLDKEGKERLVGQDQKNRFIFGNRSL